MGRRLTGWGLLEGPAVWAPPRLLTPASVRRPWAVTDAWGAVPGRTAAASALATAPPAGSCGDNRSRTFLLKKVGFKSTALWGQGRRGSKPLVPEQGLPVAKLFPCKVLLTSFPKVRLLPKRLSHCWFHCFFRDYLFLWILTNTECDEFLKNIAIFFKVKHEVIVFYLPPLLANKVENLVMEFLPLLPSHLSVSC